MRVFRLSLLLTFCLTLSAFSAFAADPEISLPAPKLDGTISVEKALNTRRTVRSYAATPLSLADAGQILWAAQGITDPKTGKRTAPSAMAKYPLTVFLGAGQVTGLPLGVYRYLPKGHALVQVGGADMFQALIAAGGQAPLQHAPAVLVITGHAERAEWAYLEAGHAAENVCLQAVSLKMGTITMAGFKPEKVKAALKLDSPEMPIYLMPLGQISAEK